MSDVNDGDHDRGWTSSGRKEHKGLSWPLRVLLVFLALVAGFFEHALGEWGGTISMAAAAVVVPILLYRRFWGQVWFWITAALLGALQVPLVAAVRPFIERERSTSMLTFVMADGLFVILVISLIRPNKP